MDKKINIKSTDNEALGGADAVVSTVSGLLREMPWVLTYSKEGTERRLEIVCREPEGDGENG